MDAQLLRLRIDRGEIVYSETEVMVHRGLLWPLEEMELKGADPQPLHREAEVGRRHPLHAEDLLVKSHRFPQVPGDHAHVVEIYRRHRYPPLIPPVPSVAGLRPRPAPWPVRA